MPRIPEDSAFGRTSCRLGSRISTVTTTVRKNNSGFRCSMPSLRFPIARVRKVPFYQTSLYLRYRYHPKKILGELVKGERSSNGFIDRILFVMPESVLKSRWNDRETPEELEIQWQQIIDKLIAQDCPHDENNELQPQCLPFDEDAKQRLYGWQHEMPANVIWKPMMLWSVFTANWKSTLSGFV